MARFLVPLNFLMLMKGKWAKGIQQKGGEVNGLDNLQTV